MCEGTHTPLIGLRAAEPMWLITVHNDNIERVALIVDKNKYAKVFDGKLGTLSGKDHPKNLEELRRFLEFVNKLAKFLPNLPDVLHPLHNLTKSHILWTWSESQQKAFDSVKELVKQAPVLK